MRVVDSYLVRDGAVVALTLHERRFLASAPGEQFLRLVRGRIPRRGDWFPRVEWDGRRFTLDIRPAPPLRESTSLWLSTLPDPRTTPTVKGPDLEALAALRQRAVERGCEDAVVVDSNGCLVETANGCLVFWQDASTVVLPAATALPSVTLAATIALWRGAGIEVVRRNTRHVDLPAWCGSSLHGWTPVTRWGVGGGGITAAPAPPVDRWNEALWSRAEKL
ncbi:aminotransferase class IV [Corynebacterium pacaense]|uniref:aminotransferase class IV n=1 Tax=Corynebacterium pacaense TaxID=1816684 RepID=UPI001FEC1394|nr:aminotransferase class IV [Corynebacterium pacaense]